MKTTHAKHNLPSLMMAISVNEENRSLVIKQVPLPKPGKGEVLVKISAAPVNPSDLVRLKNMAAEEIENHIPGIECSGKVVAAGKGIIPLLLLGKRITCCAVHPTSGTWAEYCVTRATTCFPLGKNISDEQGAMMLVNPMTVVAFFNIIKRGRHKVIISTAAAGALGRMIECLARKNGVTVINVVRNKDQEDILRRLGSRYVLNSSAENFPDRLFSLSKQLNASLALEAVGGKLTQHLVRSVSYGGTVVIYGNLSCENPEFDSRTLTQGNKNVSGFFLANYLQDNNFIITLRSLFQVKHLLKNEMKIKIQNRFALEKTQEAILTYQSNMTSGKVLLIPGLSK